MSTLNNLRGLGPSIDSEEAERAFAAAAGLPELPTRGSELARSRHARPAPPAPVVRNIRRDIPPHLAHRQSVNPEGDQKENTPLGDPASDWDPVVTKSQPLSTQWDRTQFDPRHIVATRQNPSYQVQVNQQENISFGDTASDWDPFVTKSQSSAKEEMEKERPLARIKQTENQLAQIDMAKSQATRRQPVQSRPTSLQPTLSQMVQPQMSQSRQSQLQPRQSSQSWENNDANPRAVREITLEDHRREQYRTLDSSFVPATIAASRMRVAPPVVDDYFPDLTAHGEPKRNHEYSESSASMPSDVSTFIISDTGIDDLGPSDIRKDIGADNRFETRGNNRWVKNGWAVDDSESQLQSQSYLDQFIKSWALIVHEAPRVIFPEEGSAHWFCDVDTETGQLIERIDYPEAYVNPQLVNPTLAWKQSNWTSELLCRRRTMAATKRGQRENNKMGAPRPTRGWFDDLAVFDDPGPSVTGAGVAGADVSGAQAQQASALLSDPEPEPEPEPDFGHPDAPKVACYMRPASPVDMPGISDIYAWEVNHGTQALDTVPPSAEGFKNILNAIRSLRMPFIVMVTREDQKERVIGFGFLSVWQPGLDGHCGGTSRLSARVNVFVHPEFRKMKVGFSLLDKLMSVSSDNFSSGDGYDFVDYERDSAYDSFRPHRKVKPFFKLYIQYFVRSGPAKKDSILEQAYDADLKWMATFLGHPFNFEVSNRMVCSHRTKRDEMNQEYFMDSVIFEHTCNSRGQYPELQD